MLVEPRHDLHEIAGHVPIVELRREDAVPLGRLDLGLDPKLLGDQLRQLYLKARQLAAVIDKAERRVGAFDSDVEHALVLDGLQLLAGKRLAEQTGAKHDGKAGIE